MKGGPPEVLLTGFADESAADKSWPIQVATFAALGLEYLTLRFVDLGDGTKNAMQLSDGQLQHVVSVASDNGLQFSSLGSPLGKVKLVDLDDGTSSPYRRWDEYLRSDVERACEIAQALGTRLIRGFSFYPPRHADPQPYLNETVDRIAAIVDCCDRHGLTYGLEIESNLVGRNGSLLAEIHRRVNHPGLVLVFDGANVVVQGNSPEQVYAEYQQMRPGLGWMHFKDHLTLAAEPGSVGYVDEDALHRYVPAGRGGANYHRILSDWQLHLPELRERLARRELPGVFCDLEPHLKKGGQFGGYSGPDGMGVALRAVCRLLDTAGIGYRLRDFDSLR